jgi:hypothetical protein
MLSLRKQQAKLVLGVLPGLPCCLPWSVFRNRTRSSFSITTTIHNYQSQSSFTGAKFWPQSCPYSKKRAPVRQGRSASPIKPTLDRPAGTGWASSIARTERERIQVGSFVNILYDMRFSSPFSVLFAYQFWLSISDESTSHLQLYQASSEAGLFNVGRRQSLRKHASRGTHGMPPINVPSSASGDNQSNGSRGSSE